MIYSRIWNAYLECINAGWRLAFGFELAGGEAGPPLTWALLRLGPLGGGSSGWSHRDLDYARYETAVGYREPIITRREYSKAAQPVSYHQAYRITSSDQFIPMNEATANQIHTSRKVTGLTYIRAVMIVVGAV